MACTLLLSSRPDTPPAWLLAWLAAEDLVPRLLLQAQPQAAAAPAAAAEAEAAANQEALAAAERQQHEPQQLPMEAGGSPAEQPGASSAEEPDPSPGGQAAGGTAAGAWWPAATASVALRAAGAARSAALGLTQRPWMAAANAVRSARSGGCHAAELCFPISLSATPSS